MCSVAGCSSLAQRFKLPRDPEMRLEWVQFLATANKQQFKESSWRDFRVCCNHFEDECFESLIPSRLGPTGKVRLTLKPGAVPSLCCQPDGGEVQVEVKTEEPETTTELGCQSSVSNSASSLGACRSPSPRSLSVDTSDVLIGVDGQMHPKNVNFDLITKKATRAHVKRKFVVKKTRILQLFRSFCPLCGSIMTLEKITKGMLFILKQQCLQCEYKNQWSGQVDASVLAAEDQHTLTVDGYVSSGTQEEFATGGVPDSHEVISEDSDNLDDTGESSDQGVLDSDEDWEPHGRILLINGLQKKVEAVEDVDDDRFPLPVKHKHLCEECGMFFAPHRRHTCEHKIKPFSCNICGQRLATEYALSAHRRTHNENYLFRCKYCDLTVKTKVDKVNHEQIHLNEEKPYRCPDCSETFATHTERKIHLEDHRGPPQLKCDFCGMEFLKTVRLQRHLLVHTGAKPFKCSICQRSFSQASHLKSHVRLHTGERPFKCQQCDKCFNHNSCLKNHIQRYHTGNSGSERKGRKGGRESNAGGAKGKGTSSQTVNAKKEQKSNKSAAKSKWKTTGRPIGRPKMNALGNAVLAFKEEDQCSIPVTVTHQEYQGAEYNNKESQEPNDSNVLSDSAGEDKEEVQMVIKKQTRKRGRPKKSAENEDGKKKRYSTQNGNKRLG